MAEAVAKKRFTHIARPTWKPGESVLYCGRDDPDPTHVVIPMPPVNADASAYEICSACLDVYRPWTDAPKRDLRSNTSEGLLIHIERIGGGPRDVLCGVAQPGSVITQFPEYCGPFSIYVCLLCQAAYDREAQYQAWRRTLSERNYWLEVT